MLGLIRLPLANRVTGDAVAGATITVLRAGTTVVPTLYADALGATALPSNVLTADDNGQVEFWTDGPCDLVVGGTGITSRTVRVDPVKRRSGVRRRFGIVGGSVDWRQQGGWIITAASVTRTGDTFTANLGAAHGLLSGMPVRVGCRVRELRTNEVPCTVVNSTTISYPATYAATGNSIPTNTQVNIATPTRWSPESWIRKALMHESLGDKWEFVGAAANPADNWPQITEREDEILALAAQCDVIVGSFGRDLINALGSDGSGLLPYVRLARKVRQLGCDLILAEWKAVDEQLGGSLGAQALDLIERGRLVLYDEQRDEAGGLQFVEWLRHMGDPASTVGASLPGLHTDPAHLNCDGADVCGEPFIPPLIRLSPGEPRALRAWRADVWEESGECPLGANIVSGLYSDVSTVSVSTIPATGGTVTVSPGSTSDTAFSLVVTGSCTIGLRNTLYAGGTKRTQDMFVTNNGGNACTVELSWQGVGLREFWRLVRAAHQYRVALQYGLDQLSNLGALEVLCDTGPGTAILGAGLWHGSTHTQDGLATQRLTRPESGILAFPRPVVMPSDIITQAALRLVFRLSFGTTVGTARLRVIDGVARRIA